MTLPTLKPLLTVAAASCLSVMLVACSDSGDAVTADATDNVEEPGTSPTQDAPETDPVTDDPATDTPENGDTATDDTDDDTETEEQPEEDDPTDNGSTDDDTTDDTAPETPPTPPAPSVDDLSLAITYPIDLELVEGDQFQIQWRSTEDALVHEYRVAIRDRDDVDTDLGYFSVPSTGQDGIQTYSETWLGAPVEPGKRYFAAIWAHDDDGTALASSERENFHMLYENGCYRTVVHETAYVADSEDDAYLIDGCINFDTPPQPQVVLDEDPVPGDQPGTWNVRFNETLFGEYDPGTGNTPQSCGRYLEVWPMAETAFTLNVTTGFYGIGPSSYHHISWGYRIPETAPGTPVYLSAHTCHTSYWGLDRLMQVSSIAEDICLGCDGAISEVRPVNELPPNVTTIHFQDWWY